MDPAEKPLGTDKCVFMWDKNVAVALGDDKVAAGLLPEENWSGSEFGMRFYTHTSPSASNSRNDSHSLNKPQSSQL